MQTTTTAEPHPISGAYWKWREQLIYYTRAGQPQASRPPLLLIHGFGASTDHWRKTEARLSPSSLGRSGIAREPTGEQINLCYDFEYTPQECE